MTMSANMIAKGSEAQPWSILEKLLLAQCVYKFGEDNWPLISKTLRQNALISRSSEFFNQKVGSGDFCALYSGELTDIITRIAHWSILQ